jgi:O-antigen ligase
VFDRGLSRSRSPGISLVFVSLALASSVIVGLLVGPFGIGVVMIMLLSLSLVTVSFVCLMYPEKFLIIFLFLCFSIQYLEIVPLGGGSLLDVVGILMPILFVLGAARMRGVSGHPTNLWYLLFLVGTLPALATGYFNLGRGAEALSWWLKFVNGFAILLFAQAVFAKRQLLREAAKAIVLGSLIPAAIGLWQYVNGQFVYIKRGLPFVDGGFHHPGELAYDLVFSVPIALFLTFTASKKSSRTLWMSISALLSLFVFFSWRRNVWIGFVVLLIIWTIVRRQWWLFVGLVVIFSLVSGLNVVRDNLVSEVEMALTQTSSYPDTLFSGRLVGYEAVLQGYMETPVLNKLIGVGLGSTPLLAAERGIPKGGAHNNYLVVLADSGIVGAVLYVGLLSSCLASGISLYRMRAIGRKTRSWATMFLSLVVSYCTMGFGTHLVFRLVTGEWLFWALVGSVLGVSSGSPEQQSEREKRGVIIDDSLAVCRSENGYQPS